MNFVNLMETIKKQINFDAYSRIHMDFMDDYSDTYKNIKACKSTQERAISKYISAATMKDEKTATYTKAGTTVLLLDKDRPGAESIKCVDLASKITDMWKDRRPAECYFFDSIALYKTLKKQEKTDYLLRVGDYYYNAALIAEMIECIADDKEKYIQADTCKNGALMIRQKYAALILPVVVPTCHPSKNVNMQDFLKYCDRIEKDLLKAEIHAA